MKRVAAGDHLTPWLLEPAKRPEDRADYCLKTMYYTTKKTFIKKNIL